MRGHREVDEILQADEIVQADEIEFKRIQVSSRKFPPVLPNLKDCEQKNGERTKVGYISIISTARDASSPFGIIIRFVAENSFFEQYSSADWTNVELRYKSLHLGDFAASVAIAH